MPIDDLLFENNISDPTKVGTGGMQGIRYNRDTFKENGWSDDEIDNFNDYIQKGNKWRDDFYNGNYENYEMARGFEHSVLESQGWGEEFSDYGKSSYDKKAKTRKDLENLQDLRAREQGTALKWVNGLGKCAVYAGTTALDSTIGTIWGVVEGIGTLNDGKDGTFWEKFYNNDFSRCMRDIQKASEEAMPNYQTKKEQNNPWYENIGTANFWADSILKNLGFTIGTFAGSALVGLVTGGTGLIPGLTRGFLTKVGVGARGVGVGEKFAMSAVSGWNEARQEAGNAYDDNLDRYKKEFIDMADDMGMVDWKYENFQSNTDKLTEEINYLQNILDKGVLQTASGYDPETGMGAFTLEEIPQEERAEMEARIQELTEERDKLFKLKDKYEDVEFRARASANSVMAVETVILALSNSIGALSGFKTFYSNAARNVELGITRGASKFADRAYYLGTKMFEELNEEMMQGWTNHTFADMYSAKYNYENRHKLLAGASSLELAFKDGFVKQYGTAEGWQDGVVGAVCGVIPNFMPHKVRKADGTTEMKWFQGGLVDIFSEDFKEADRVGEFLRNAEGDSKVEQAFKYLTEQSTLQDLAAKALQEGDKFNYENYHTKYLTNAILNYMAAGKLDDLKALIGDKDMTDEELDAFIYASSEVGPDGKAKNNFGLTDKDGNLLVNTPEEREAYKKKISEYRKNTLNLIDKLQRAVNTIDNSTGGKLTNEHLGNLAWITVFPSELNDRYNSIIDEIQGNEKLRTFIETITGIKEGKLDEESSKLEEVLSKSIEDGKKRKKDEFEKAYDKFQKENKGKSLKDFIRTSLGKEALKNGIQAIYDNLEKVFDGKTLGEHIANSLDSYGEGDFSLEEKEKFVSALKDASKLTKLKNLYRKLSSKYMKKTPEEIKKEFDDFDNIFKSIYNKNVAKEIGDQIDAALKEGAPKKHVYIQYVEPLIKSSDKRYNDFYKELLKGKHGSWIKGAANMLGFERSLNEVIDNDSELSDSEKERIKNVVFQTLANEIDTPKKAFENIQKVLSSLKGSKSEGDIDILYGSSSDLNDFMERNKNFLTKAAMESGMDMIYDSNSGSMHFSDEDLRKLMYFAKNILVNDSISKAEALLNKAKEFFSEVDEWTKDLNDGKKVAEMIKAMNKIESRYDISNASQTAIVSTALDVSTESILKNHENELSSMKDNANIFLEKIFEDAMEASNIMLSGKIEEIISPALISHFIAINSFFDIDSIIKNGLVGIEGDKDFLMAMLPCTHDENMRVLIADAIQNENYNIVVNLKSIVSNVDYVLKSFDSFYSGTDHSMFSISDEDIKDIGKVNFIIDNLIKKLEDKKEIEDSETDKLKTILNKVIERGLYAAAGNTKDSNLKIIKENILNGENVFTQEDLQALAVDFNKNIDDVIKKDENKNKVERTKAEIEKEAQNESSDVTKEELSDSIEKSKELKEEENKEIVLDNDTIRSIFKVERNGKKVNVLQPIISQMHIPSLRNREFITFAQGADRGNVNYHTDPHEIQEYLSNYMLGDEFVNIFNMLNDGTIYNLWENGTYAHQLYAMTDEEMNNLYNSNPDGKPKNYYWRVGTADNGQDTYYMYEQEVIEYTRDNKGNVSVSRITSKDGSELKLMKDANGNNIKRSEYKGKVIVKEKGADGKYTEREESMSNIIESFRKPSLKANLFFAIRDNEGRLIPIGLMPRIENSEGLRYGNIYSESGLDLQTSLNFIFGRTFAYESPERKLLEAAGPQLPHTLGNYMEKTSVKEDDGTEKEAYVKVEGSTEKSSGVKYNNSFLNYQGHKGYELREIYEAEAFDYYANYSNIAKSNDPNILSIEVSKDGDSVVVKYKNNKEYKYSKKNNDVYKQIQSLRENRMDEPFLFFDNNNKPEGKRRTYGFNVTDEAQIASRKSNTDKVGKLINTLFDNTGNEYVGEVGVMNEESSITENGKTTRSTKKHYVQKKKAVRLEGYTIDNFINGIYQVEEKGTYNNLDSLKTSDGISASTLISMGDAEIGVVVKGKGAASIRTSEGDNLISDGKEASSLKNGMSVLILTNADGTKTNIPIGTARYTNETSSKFDESLGIKESFEKAIKELISQIEKSKIIKDEGELKKARLQAVLNAFNFINEAVNIPIGKVFRQNGMGQVLRANLAYSGGKNILIIERTTEDGQSKIENSRIAIDLSNEENAIKELKDYIAEIERPLKIGSNVLNNSDNLSKYIEAGVFTTSLKSLTPVNAYFQVADGTRERTKEEKEADKKVFGSYSELLSGIERLKNQKLTEGRSFANIGGKEITIIKDDFGFSYEIYDREGNKLTYDEIDMFEQELGFRGNAPWRLIDIFNIATKYKELYTIIKNNLNINHPDKELVKSVLHGSIVRIRRKKNNGNTYAYYDFENGNIYFDSEAWDEAGKKNNVEVGDKVAVKEGQSDEKKDTSVINTAVSETKIEGLGSSFVFEESKEELGSVSKGDGSAFDIGSLLESEGNSESKNVQSTQSSEESEEENDDLQEYKINTEESTIEEEKAINESSLSRQELPWMSLGERRMVTKGLDRVASNGHNAWVEFKKNCVILYDASASKDEYRNNYHSASQLCLSDKEREALRSEVRKLYGKSLSDMECIEKLADMFMDYILSNGSTNISSKPILKWFNELRHKTDVFRNYNDKVDTFFNNLYKSSNSSEYDLIIESYNSSDKLKEIGTKEQYVDYIRETTKNSGIKGVAYTTDYLSRNGEYVIVQKTDKSDVTQNEFAEISGKNGENTIVYVNNEAYNRKVTPCITISSSKPKTTKNNGKTTKFALSSNPIVLGSGKDMINFSNFIRNNNMSEDANRRVWSRGLSQKTVDFLSMRGISVSEFNKMSDIIKDKIIECL